MRETEKNRANEEPRRSPAGVLCARSNYGVTVKLGYEPLMVGVGLGTSER